MRVDTFLDIASEVLVRYGRIAQTGFKRLCDRDAFIDGAPRALWFSDHSHRAMPFVDHHLRALAASLDTHDAEHDHANDTTYHFALYQ